MEFKASDMWCSAMITNIQLPVENFRTTTIYKMRKVKMKATNELTSYLWSLLVVEGLGVIIIRKMRNYPCKVEGSQ